MATFVKTLLSNSTNGKQIKINATGTPGTDIHTSVSGTTDMDEIWIWAVNSQATAAKLTMEWGEATAPDGNIEVIIPGESGLYLVVPGLLLQNSMELKAFASYAGVVLINGFVNRISP